MDIEESAPRIYQHRTVKIFGNFAALAFAMALTLFHSAASAAVGCVLPDTSDLNGLTDSFWRESIDKASSGEAEAQYSIGIALVLGTRFEKDLVRGFCWLAQAAEQGHAASQKRVGRAYHYGEGTLQNYEKARVWYERAFASGERSAGISLSTMYQKGKIVPPGDPPGRAAMAHMWANLAAVDGDWLAIEQRKQIEQG